MTTGTGANGQEQPRSIHRLVPLESGGVRARRGLKYQDHVAAGFFVRMLADEELDGVWCEVEDDITLIWRRVGCDAAEFVQVKSDAKVWSVAEICRRRTSPEPRPGPRSLLEKSLAHDRCAEPCSFRVVSAWPLQPTLVLLMEALDCAARSGSLAFEEVVSDIVARAQSGGSFLSENGRGAEFWARSVVWEYAGPEDAVDNANHRRFERFLEKTGHRLSMDLRDELYGKLLILAENAACAPLTPDLDAKKTRRRELIERLEEQIFRGASDPGPQEQALTERLEQAGLPQELVVAALDLRRQYRQRRRSPTYLSEADLQAVELRVLARLHELLVAWNAGEFDDTPAQFLQRSIVAVKELRSDTPQSVAEEDLLGLLYDITARGRHRFTRYAREELLSGGMAIGGEAA